MGKPHPEFVREYVRRLHAEGRTTIEIHRETGIHYGTIKRWINPAYNERQLRRAREKKRANKKPCPDCGKLIWYTSAKCAECTRPGRYWTKERVIKAIQDWAASHDGKPPTATQWQHAKDGHPAATTVYGSLSEFPSWNDAIAQAGFTPRASSPGPGHISWDPEEGKRMRLQGLTDEEIGRRLGVTGSAIQQKLGRRGEIRPPNLGKRTREQRISDLRRALDHQ